MNGNENKVQNSDAKGRAATIIAAGGLVLSLIGNIEQYRKNQDDKQIATQQIQILQQQADSAQGQLQVAQAQLKIAQDQLQQRTSNCEGKRSEHDDALNAVHIYDQQITKYQAELMIQKNSLAMARESGDKFNIARYGSLADSAQLAIDSLQKSRDEAAQRVKELEDACKF